MLKYLKLIRYKHFLFVTTLILVAIAIILPNFFKNWNYIASDGFGYYAYLPAVFLDKDIEFGTTLNKYAEKRNWDLRKTNEFNGLKEASQDKWINKYPVGIAVIESPFFFIADGISKGLNLERDGFGPLYQAAIAIAGIIYCQTGFYFTYKVLVKRFKEHLTLMLLTMLFFGTNILHYAIYEPSMSHIYSFTLVSMSLYLLDKYIATKSSRLIIYMGILISLLGLIRNINLLFGGVLLGVVIFSNPANKRFALLLKTLAVWGVTLLITFIPQMLYWKVSAGSAIAYGYTGEKFFWTNPQFFKILFSVYNGAFFWHPILLLFIPGFYYWVKSKELLARFYLVFLVIWFYILSCWWAWWFGYSFGHRAFTDYYLLLFISIGYFLQHLFTVKKKYIYFTAIIIALLCVLNLIQMNNYWRGIVSGENLSWTNYWNNFADPHLSRLIKRIIAVF